MTELAQHDKFSMKQGQGGRIILAILVIFVIGIVDTISYYYGTQYVEHHITQIGLSFPTYLYFLDIAQVAILLSISFVLFTRITVRGNVFIIILILLLGCYLGEVTGNVLLILITNQLTFFVPNTEYSYIFLEPVPEALFLSFACAGAMFVRGGK